MAIRRAAGDGDQAAGDRLLPHPAARAPWGFDPGQITSPVLIVHGGQDRIVPSAHGEWLARRCPAAELWLQPADGHISVLRSGQAALDWLGQHAR